jgi:hypothetical protein
MTSPERTSLSTSRITAGHDQSTPRNPNRRRIDVYHRALRAARSTEERAAVIARYNRVFAAAAPELVVTLAS